MMHSAVQHSVKFMLLTLSAAMAAQPVMALNVPQCTDAVRLVSPASVVQKGAIPLFRWSAEPKAAASREVSFFPVTMPAAVSTGKATAFKSSFPVKELGAYGWFVTFRDKAGRAICRSLVGNFSVQQDRAVMPTESAKVAGVYIDKDGRYVIVLRDSSYKGPYTTLVDADIYDASAYDLGKQAIGLVIYGNDRFNSLVGSSGNDVIWGFDDFDYIVGGPGDDILVGGKGDDIIIGQGSNDTDTIYGGPGMDNLTTVDADGFDTIYGGDDGTLFSANVGDQFIPFGPNQP